MLSPHVAPPIEPAAFEQTGMDVADHRARAFGLALAGQRAQRLFERRDLRKRCELAGEEREVLPAQAGLAQGEQRSEEHTSELQSLMRISYAVFCLKQKKASTITPKTQKK